jgi:hypothetical protein
MVYHWARYLEMDIATADDRSLVEKENSKRLQRAFVDYLSLSFAPFQKTDLADDFLRLLAEWWDRDHELRETIQRATGNGECGKALTRLLVQFVEKNEQLALQNGGKSDHEH